MFCLKCGEVLPDDASFCPYCGTKIGENDDANKAIVYVEKMNEDTPTYENKNSVTSKVSKILNNENWIRGIATVMCIIAVSYCLWLQIHYKLVL